MKSFLFALLLPLLVTPVLAGPRDEAKASNDATKSAVELFKNGRGSEALAEVSKRPAEPYADGRLSSNIQGLVETAVTLFNQRRLRAAQDATWQALAAAETLLNGKTTLPAERRAQLCCSLSFLCENVLRDKELAGTLLTLATQVNPNDKLAARRQETLRSELRQRSGGR